MKKKNLLFIFTDEQAVNTMKCYGNSKIKTPNMDRLAEESFIFEKAYVTQPVCTPSRSTLMTGLYPHTNGCTENNIPLQHETPCLTEMGDLSSYRKAYYGKWHLGDEVFNQHGFDEWKSIEDTYNQYYSEGKDKSKVSSYNNFLIEQGMKPDVKNKGYFSRQFSARLPEQLSKPAYLANEAIDFLEKNDSNPFILYVNFFEPHMPYFSCRDDQYSLEDIELPPNFHHELGDDHPLKLLAFKQALYDNGHSGLSLKTEGDWKKLISNYWGLVSLVDTHLGRILDKVEELNLLEDTIIIYTSDHGDMMGSHQLTAKCTMFEEAVKVPLLMRIPGLENNGKKIIEPVSQIDLVPSILDAMEQDIPNTMQGYSLIPFLKEQGELVEKDVFIEWNGMNGGFGDVVGGAKVPKSSLKVGERDQIVKSLGDPVRTIITPEGWKYSWSTIGDDELYNLNEDPYEMNNLVKNTEYRSVIDDLKLRIKNWKERTKDIA
ncbi:sulfatase-like hydrolase/transferase [Vallitalea okinawensis]|uniref:sulfatase-like hydrolase/transferase n=1 Tax=Vallitalea okinawensis TaxID=2078660 RepID=UPI000CFE0DF0|nr:sulfatase-like hydrolase/transferase [Vallitalea okinawensis]